MINYGRARVRKLSEAEFEVTMADGQQLQPLPGIGTEW